MKRVWMPLAAAVLLCSPVWGQGQFSQPWGVIESGDRSATRNEEPVAITRIDGRSTRNTRRPDPVEPGKRVVQVTFTSARGVVGQPNRTIEIHVQPCKRYRVVAHFQTSARSNWEPAISAIEDIGECRRRFFRDQDKAAK
jgi:hypothetical protein